MAGSSPQDLALNALFFKQLEECRDDLKKQSEAFRTCELQRPMEKHGRQPFDIKKLLEVVKKGQTMSDGKTEFTAYGPVNSNIFQLPVTGSDGVPVNKNNVKKLMSARLSTPQEARGSAQPIHIGFVKADCTEDGVKEMKIVSAEELNYALILRIWERMDQLATAEELEEWLDVCVNWPCVWECHIGPQALHWRSVNIREDYATSFDLLTRSAVQKLFELMTFKSKEERARSMQGSRGKTTQISNKQLYELWSANVKFSTLSTGEDRQGGNEMQFKPAFVEACVYSWSRLFVYEKVRNSVLEAEDSVSTSFCSCAVAGYRLCTFQMMLDDPSSINENWICSFLHFDCLVVCQETFGKNTLWSSVYQLEAIAKKLTGRKDIEESAAFVMQGSLYLWRTGKIQPSAFTARNIAGKGLSGGKGTADFLLLKWGFLQKFFGMIHNSALSESQKFALKTAFMNWGNYVLYFEPEKENPNLTWQAQLPDAIRPLLELMEALIYDVKYDAKA